MPRRTLSRPAAVATVVAAAAVLSPLAAPAQAPQPGAVTASASITGVHQFDTDLDQGGDFRWSAAIASGAVTRQFTPQFSAGLALRYDYEDWKFSRPAAFGGAAPWNSLNAPSIGVDFSYTIGSDYTLGVTPEVGWSYESGAKTSDALIYGALLTATKVFSPNLVLGLGAGVFRKIDETKVIPFAIVRWQINERWRLGNPFPAGPAGGAGLELVYAPDDRWEFAAGGTKRSTRFRLDSDGMAPGGIGDNRAYPLFARVTRNIDTKSNVDFYAGIAVGGRLRVIDTHGVTVAKDDYATAPFVGLTLTHRF